MKKAIFLCFIVFTVCLTNVHGQDTSERKYKSLQRAEAALFKMGFDLDTMQTFIYPEVVSNRSALAPNYPDISTLERSMDARNTAFINWIESYPQQFEAYYEYLRNFVNQ